jgi:hypothetical protein
VNADRTLVEIQARIALLQPLAPPLLETEGDSREQGSQSAGCSVDETLEGSFPASDPPSWMPGMFRLAPVACGPAEHRRDNSLGTVRRLLRRAAALF